MIVPYQDKEGILRFKVAGLGFDIKPIRVYVQRAIPLMCSKK